MSQPPNSSLISEMQVQSCLDQRLLKEEHQKQKFIKKTSNNSNDKSPTGNAYIFIVILIVGLGLLAYSAILISQSNHQQAVVPMQVRLSVYDNLTIQKGNSRVVQVLFYSGNDDRASPDFKVVNKKDLFWQTKPQGIISVDKYGRIQALQEGSVILKIVSVTNKLAQDTKTINVVSGTSFSQFNYSAKRIINYTGQPRLHHHSLQKLVIRVDKENVQTSEQIPNTIKKVSLDPVNSVKTTKVVQQNNLIIWTIQKYADNSGNSYIKRIDKNLQQTDRDYAMKFIGTRYLPQDGKSVISIEDDQQMGIWTVNKNGSVTHIKMTEMTYDQKARLMVQNTQKYVIRQGIASGADFDKTKNQWITAVSDNDGLWTSLYASGQLMRYDYLRRVKQSADKIQQARQSALNSLKAVLTIAWISGRNGTVDAKVRAFNNSRTTRACRLSPFYLKKGMTPNVMNYVGSPADKTGYFGFDAGKVVDGASFGGSFKYSLQPFEINDWTLTQQAATTKRTLNWFMSRTFTIPQLDGNRFDGLFFKRYPNGSHTVLNQASLLYDYKNNEHPTLELGNLPLPQILKSILFVNGKQYDVNDIVYKGETSTDEVIGHIFLYKIAFDIMSQEDPEQKQLKDLIRQTMVNFCQHLLNNGYTLVDATGLGTSWGQLVRDFLNSDYTMEDGPLKAIQTLLCFKLTHYMTGDEQYKKEYEFLLNDPAFKYGQLVSKFWEKWVYFNVNEDYEIQKNMYRFNMTKDTSQEELLRHHAYTFHYSDDQEGMMAFYLAFQLQDNNTILDMYKKGMQAFWNHIKKTQNPLWYFIYQLAYPQNKQLKDGFGNDMLDVASWQLSRHVIDTTHYQAFIQGSREDVILQGITTVNPYKIIGNRTNLGDAQYVDKNLTYKIFPQFNPKNIYQIKVLPGDERAIKKFNAVTYANIDSANSNSMQPSTTYTLPYWLGVYHGMLKYKS